MARICSERRYMYLLAFQSTHSTIELFVELNMVAVITLNRHLHDLYNVQ